MRKPSILFMNRAYPPMRAATGRILRDLARSFAKDGWTVTVITTGPKPGKIRDGKVRVIRLKGPKKPKGMAGYMAVWAKMFWAALRQPRADLVVTMTDPPLIVNAGRAVKALKGSYHIHWCHDLYPDILPALDINIPDFMMKYFKRLSRRAMKKADKVIVIGRCMGQYLKGQGIEAGKIAMIPNWPDKELVGPESMKHELNGSANGKANGVNGTAVNGHAVNGAAVESAAKFRVLYAGNIGRAHPVQTILKAAEILHDPHPEIEFVFVGKGAGYEEVARQRAQDHLDNIRLMPYQPASRLRKVMESGDVHLVSVKEEAAGMLVPCKLYSALAVERPCIFIGPAASEAAKVIHDFKAGSVIAQGDAEALAEAIRRYRMSSADWFSAQEGAARAAQIYLPAESMNAWIRRARDTIKIEAKGEAR